ncbi:metal-dependent hydrolase [Thermococcus sp.]|uniref:metal-dependent hydrolase n=1 Tax=Thermococcus sp. TaxID=35749 RepID=UPI00262FA68B|nr:metal-dependent hydrolase [Thermococcus sp.]
MDPFEHASIPTLVYLALSEDPAWGGALALIIGATFPDLDAFTREHRSYLHSLLVAIPVFAPAYISGNHYALLFSLGWLSHLFLDFFTGVIPPVYPLSRQGWGVTITARGGPSGTGFEVHLLERYPDPRHDYELNIGGSTALALLTLIALVIRLH